MNDAGSKDEDGHRPDPPFERLPSARDVEADDMRLSAGEPISLDERTVPPTKDVPLQSQFSSQITWPPQIDRDRIWQLTVRAARIAGLVVAVWLGVVILLIAAYRFINPPFSALMLFQRLAGTEISQTWVPIERISPQLIRAVVISEDARFCRHWGVDLKEVEAAIERARGGVPRGASTISMQVTKNLFLWQSKSYIRKAIELPLTFITELFWPKARMLEIYLNIAEWGPGIFGAEAAARYHFNKSALKLSEREAAQLAASLPNPMVRDAGDPGPRTSRLAAEIQSRMRTSFGTAACILKKG